MNLAKTISLIHRKMNAELNTRLSEIGLSTAMARLMLHLHQSGAMTQADLCRELELDKSTVAKALAKMESKGLINKSVNPSDVRSHIVSITDDARLLIPKTKEIISGWSQDATSAMTIIEREALYELLDKVASQATSMCNK